MMRAILDTNVVVSALIWGGTPMDVLEAATEGRMMITTSTALLTELAEVLDRPHLKTRLQRARGTVEAALSFYAALTVHVTPREVSRVVPGDPDDDEVIAAAVAAQADMIVSGDKHLLGLGSYQGILILSPAEALRRVANAPA